MKPKLNPIQDGNFRSSIGDLESLRQRLVLKIFLCIGCPFAAYFFYRHADFQFFYVATGAFFLLLILNVVGYQNYRQKYKTDVFEKVVAGTFPGFVYSPNSSITDSEYVESGMSQWHNRFTGEDLVTGNIKGLPVRFSEAVVHHKNRIVLRGRNSSSTRVVFRGIILVVEGPLKTPAPIYVESDLAESFFGQKLGSLLQDLGSTFTDHGPVVKFADPEFEKHFVVRSHAEAAARAFLDGPTMRSLIELKSRFSWRGIKFSFVGQKFFVLIPTSKNFFEPPLFSSAADLVSHHETMKAMRYVLAFGEKILASAEKFTAAR